MTNYVPNLSETNQYAAELLIILYIFTLFHLRQKSGKG